MQFKCANNEPHPPPPRLTFPSCLQNWIYNFNMLQKEITLRAKRGRGRKKKVVVRQQCSIYEWHLWQKREHFPIHTHTHTHTLSLSLSLSLSLPLLIPWHLHRPRCSDGLLDNRDNGAAVFHIGPGVYYSSGLALFPKRSYTKSPNLLFSRPCGSRVKAHLWTCMCHFIWCHYANGTAHFSCAKKQNTHTHTHTGKI